MPVREFANQKALIDYAERNCLVYLWEGMSAFARRQRMLSPLPAFTKRQRLLSPDQYEIVDVRTSRGVRTAMLARLSKLSAAPDTSHSAAGTPPNRRTSASGAGSKSNAAWPPASPSGTAIAHA
jgi:hypothetical protein